MPLLRIVFVSTESSRVFHDDYSSKTIKGALIKGSISREKGTSDINDQRYEPLKSEEPKK